MLLSSCVRLRIRFETTYLLSFPKSMYLLQVYKNWDIYNKHDISLVTFYFILYQMMLYCLYCLSLLGFTRFPSKPKVTRYPPSGPSGPGYRCQTDGQYQMYCSCDVSEQHCSNSYCYCGDTRC